MVKISQSTIQEAICKRVFTVRVILLPVSSQIGSTDDPPSHASAPPYATLLC